MRVLAAAYVLIEQRLGDAYAILDSVADTLITVGFVSANDFSMMVKPLEACDLPAEVLAMLDAPALDDEIDRIIERELA